jgi:hypothetical protein
MHGPTRARSARRGQDWSHGVGVSIHRGKLFLNGHSITGSAIGVACADKCSIYGPGTIGGNGTGVDQLADVHGGSLTVRAATVTGNSALGLGGDKVRVTGTTVTGNGGFVVSGHPAGGGIIGRDRVSAGGDASPDTGSFG